MISVDSFKKSIYSPELFEDSGNTAEYVEKQNCKKCNDIAFQKLRVNSKGHIIKISNGLLKKSKDIYKGRTDNSPSFKLDCDGILIVNYGQKGTLVIIELKSGYKGVQNHGVDQILTSYVRTKIFLSTLRDYNTSEYNDIAFVISYPEQQKEEYVPSSVKENTMTNGLETYSNKVTHDLRKKKEAVVKLTDFPEFASLGLSPNLINNKLTIKHIEVPSGQSNHEINLDEYV